MSALTPADVSAATELTLVRPDATRDQIQQLCADAIQRKCYGVCVNSSRVIDAYHFGADHGLKIISTIGFPFGATDPDAKRYEAECAVDAGAHELDAVMNTGLLKDGRIDHVLRELRDIVEAADERPVKTIIDLTLLNPQETLTAIQIVIESGCQYLSISAEVEKVAAIAKNLSPKFALKAFASQMSQSTRLLEAGAKRIGQVAS